jgi:hypothetical protein
MHTFEQSCKVKPWSKFARCVQPSIKDTDFLDLAVSVTHKNEHLQYHHEKNGTELILESQFWSSQDWEVSITHMICGSDEHNSLLSTLRLIIFSSQPQSKFCVRAMCEAR